MRINTYYMNEIDWQNVGLQMVQEITAYIRRRVNESGSTVIHKLEEERNPIYAIDEEVENLARDYLEREQIPVVIKSEDRPAQNITSNPLKTFILDPLDGSMNAARGIPFYCVSLAIGDLSLNRKFSLDNIDSGIIQNVCSGATFVAVKNRGAYLNGHQINTSRITKLSDALISIYTRHAPQNVLTLANAVRSIRTNGCAALELCEVARGAYDGFVYLSSSIKIYDIAAGAFIIKEAGGTVSLVQNNIMQEDQVSIVASSNEELHSSIMNKLNEQE